jgi:hypothetical protein
MRLEELATDVSWDPIGGTENEPVTTAPIQYRLMPFTGVFCQSRGVDEPSVNRRTLVFGASK